MTEYKGITGPNPGLEIRGTDEPYSGEFSQVIEVLQGEVAVTTSDDSKPVLATYGAGPCLAVCGYDESGVGFMGHYFGPICVKNQQDFLKEVAKLGGKRFRLTMRGTMTEPKTVEALLRYLGQNRIATVDKEILGESGGSLALDTRTGETYSYNPQDNPDTREITPSTSMRIKVNSIQGAKLIYTPLQQR